MPSRFPVIWLTGNSGAGKTTLAYGAREFFNEIGGTQSQLDRRLVVLDGDEMRATISTEDGLSHEDRRKHNLRVARLARLLRDQGFLVVVAVIAPFTEVRVEIDALCSPRWVYVKRSGLGASDRPYEEPTAPHLVIDNDRCGIEEARSRFIDFLLGQVASPESQVETACRKVVAESVEIR